MVLVSRRLLEVITRPTFFCNVMLGLCAWTVEQAQSAPFPSAPLTLTGNEWEQLYVRSVRRRTFETVGLEVDEYHHILTDFIYFVDFSMREKELALLKLQRWYRRLWLRPQQTNYLWNVSSGYATTCFTLQPSAKVLGAIRLLGGWAFLRRRSRDVGEFIDMYHSEWDEHIDNQTSDFFYWSEKGNRYQWVKPDIPISTEEEGEESVPLEVGQDVLFWFDGHLKPEIVRVTRLRTDDSTGEILHDIESKEKNTPPRREICLSRDRLSIPPLSREETRLRELEKQWTNQIRIASLSDERKEHYMKMKLIEEEGIKLDEIMKNRKMRVKTTNNQSLRGGLGALNELQQSDEAGIISHPWAGERPTSILILENVHMRHPLLLKAREKRGAIEAIDKVDELIKADKALRADRFADVMAALSAATIAALASLSGEGPPVGIDEDIATFVEMAMAVGLSARSVELAMIRTAELRVQLQLRIEQRNLRQLV